MKRIKQNYFSETINRQADRLAEEYASKGADSVAKKDKQLQRGHLVLFDRGFEIVVMTVKTREFVCQYEEAK